MTDASRASAAAALSTSSCRRACAERHEVRQGKSWTPSQTGLSGNQIAYLHDRNHVPIFILTMAIETPPDSWMQRKVWLAL